MRRIPWTDHVAAAIASVIIVSPLWILVTCTRAQTETGIAAGTAVVCTVLEAVDSSGVTQKICASDAEIIKAVDALLPLFGSKLQMSGQCSKVSANDPDGGVRRWCLTNDQLAQVIAKINASRPAK